jgi:ketosteroid isomerase-like protein
VELVPGADSASVLRVVDAFHDALRVGDVARVASLSVPGTTLVDQEDGVRWRLGGEESRLPSSLDASPGSGGLTWEVAERSVRRAGDARVVTLRWQAVIAGEPVEWWGVESVVLVPTDEGWRLTHVHRSRGGDPTPGPGGPGDPP